MELPIYTVDAFTTHPFEGNPAAVCIIKHDQVILQLLLLSCVNSTISVYFVS